MQTMAKNNGAEQKKKFDEESEKAAAKAEPMGSVAAAVPRDAGSAPEKQCDEESAPAHEGGEATLVAGKEAHKADQHIEKMEETKRR